MTAPHIEYRLAGTRVIWALLALMAGCGHRSQDSSHAGDSPGSSTGAAPHQLKKSDLSSAELQYGIAPVPDSSVTYQPDVVLVGGGPEAIRSQDPNGFVWTIDATAPRATELVPGKVFFMTNRAVGRVVDVRKDGDNLTIIASPVTLTEIVTEAHIEIKDMPIDFSEALPYTSNGLPGQQVLAQTSAPYAPAQAPGRDTLLHANYVSDAGWHAYTVGDPTSAIPTVPPLPDVPDVSSALLEKNFKLLPNVSTAGVGLTISADGGGLKVSASTLIQLAKPTLNVTLIIEHAAIKEASIELKGAAGLSWTFDAGTSVGLKGNISAILQPDTDFSIPIGGLGPVPLAVTVRQRFMIKTGLGVRNSTLHASGQYSWDGSFKMGYAGGNWNAAKLANFTAKQSMTRNTGGLSMGAEGLDLTNQMRVIVGVGAFGFTAGPFLSFTSAVAAFRGSDIGMIACNGATLVISLSGGVGYFIPSGISRAINFILRSFHIEAKVPTGGGLESAATKLIEKTSVVGGCGFDTGNSIGTLNGPV